jgi:hypothetical protein
MTLPDNNDNEGLKRRMAWYVLSLGVAIKEMDGVAVLNERIQLATKKIAMLKSAELESIAPAERHQALAERLDRMLGDFGGENIQVSVSGGGTTQTINNPECPCLPPFISQADLFGFGPEEVRKYACMICMGSYSGGAKLTGIKFSGKLTAGGCWMSFSLRPK